jgi:DDE superfamily endonuclease
VRHNQDAAAAAATVAGDARSALLADLLGRVAGCFPRRETRQCCSQMVRGLLMELDDHNCWTIAEAVGHFGPHRLQHLLSRAVWDDRQVLDTASAWAVSHLDDGDAVLIVDETADEKSSADCAGAARQYSGTVGGVALCQVAVTVTYATGRGHALIGRALYLPKACAADEERRELAGCRRRCCSPPSRSWPAPCWTARTPWGSAPPSWQETRPMAAVSCAAASASAGWAMCVAVALQREQEASSDPDAELIPVTIPGTAAAPARHRHSATPARPGAPAALVDLATPPPAPLPPNPPALERLRRTTP